MKNTLLPIITLSVCLSSALTTTSQAATIITTADTTIRGGTNVGNNYDDLNNVGIKTDDSNNDNNRRTGYIKFDMSTINSTITDATLSMISAFSATDGTHTFTFWGINDAENLDGWDASTLTANNAPAINAATTLGMDTSLLTNLGSQVYVFNPTTGIAQGDTFTFSSATLTSFLSDRTNDDLVTIIVTRTATEDNGDTPAFRSLENGDGSDAASLNLTLVPVPEPSSTALLGLGGLALMLRRRRLA